MNHNMKSPCSQCPFRNDIPGYLRQGRVLEIGENALRGGNFPCHKTIDFEDNDDGTSSAVQDVVTQQCAGAEIFAMKQGRGGTQLGRIAERLGLAAPLDMKAPICGSMEELLKVHANMGKPPKKKSRKKSKRKIKEQQEEDYCCVCDDGCEAPAGFQTRGNVVDGQVFAKYSCSTCGNAVCGSCSTVKKEKGKSIRICNLCSE